MRSARPIFSYVREFGAPPLVRIEVLTNDSIKNEVFGSLEFLSEIDEAGKEFLKNIGHTKKLDSTYKQFQAFIRQAKAFYDAADVLHYRASSLNYYYSFLNLVKAFITLFDPPGVEGRINHGITQKLSQDPLRKQFVVSTVGVFPKFYEFLVGRSLQSGTRFNVTQILGYCSDVSVEYEMAAFGRPKIVPCQFAIGGNQNQSEFHALLCTNGFYNIERYRKSLSDFNKYFEEVTLSRPNAREIFGIMAERLNIFRFFESRRVYPVPPRTTIPAGRIVGDACSAFAALFMPNVYHTEVDFCLSPPLRINYQIPMNEILAIYLVMFFLSNSVRYNPAYLEKLFASSDAWIVGRFVKTSPITFLRYMRNMITRQNFIYRGR